MKFTTMAKADEIQRSWHLVDATDQVLGRLAVKIARILMGKHRPSYTPHCDTGDFVVVTNAERIAITGKKKDTKVYRYHTQWVGNLKEFSYRDMMTDRPEKILWYAVRRMLPKTKLGEKMVGKLKIYAGAEHPHAAQMPKALAK